MSNKPATSVQIDFMVNVGDLFRANLALAKARLLLGLGFSLMLVAGLIIIFLTINEKVILVQTSPLFIGLPLVAVGGQLLRMHATCRKYVSSLSPPQRLMRYVFSDAADWFEVRSGESFGRIGWADVWKIAERPRYFLIFISKYDVCVIPKLALANTKELNLFRRILTAKLGSRTELLAQAVD